MRPKNADAGQSVEIPDLPSEKGEQVPAHPPPLKRERTLITPPW